MSEENGKCEVLTSSKVKRTEQFQNREFPTDLSVEEMKQAAIKEHSESLAEDILSNPEDYVSVQRIDI